MLQRDSGVQGIADNVRLGLRGAAIGGSVAGEDFYDPKFHPVWAKAEELGAVLRVLQRQRSERRQALRIRRWDLLRGYNFQS